MFELIFNTATTERRAAVKKNGKVIELYMERSTDERIAGSIYKGRVKDVLPGMEAAFVDIGREKNGFLHRNELVGYKQLKESEIEKEKRSISEFITQGQEIIVQVTKEEFGDKGARLTENVSLPGKYTVFMPEGGYIGVSKRMSSEDIREHWRSQVRSMLEDREGIVVRTSCENRSEKIVEQDIFYLREDWHSVLRTAETKRAPALIYQDGGIIERLLRDYAFENMDRIVVDHFPDVRYIKRLLRFEEEDIKKVFHYKGKENIFSAEGIEKDLDKALKPKVWLKSGGFLMIEKTEALTVIDVNTGRFTGRSDLEETIRKTNTEAAYEIASQLRLRDISGIIVIDFIDMKQNKNKQKVVSALKHALTEDHTKTNVGDMSSFGLVEMTRKKVRRSLADSQFSNCEVCRGSGRLLSEEAMAYRVERIIHEHRELEAEAMVLELPVRVFNWLNEQGKALLKKWEERYPFVLYFLAHPAKDGIHIRFTGTAEEAEKRSNP
ncbi:Rne/Rng family ribonuclease [Alteribacillus sp. YIM 98480]|uniref:Rne/Rng family ribonuclease n=1 Tax=Alteribacillus sp. YIM 98480 TaxID=2606599 RepID=UPI00131C3506|nr:Rne/Rng family ribonuclease [Alteribacillus sp. YIM 98480]